MDLFNGVEIIIDMLRAFPQELSDKSLSLTASISGSMIRLFHSIVLPEPMSRLWVELLVEWPEVAEIVSKLVRGAELSEIDKQWIKELADASGWDVEDLVEDLKSFGLDSSTRAERYRKFFEEYYMKALQLAREGDTRQAGEKIRGAVTALIKLHTAKKGVPIMHWDHGKLHNYVSNSVEKELRNIFRRLLLVADELHRHFYEGFLDTDTFNVYFNEACKLIEEIRKALESRD